MPHFFVRLIPPRPDFSQTITPEERLQMQQHAAYVHGFFDRGKVLAFGPVMDPEGAFGVAVVEAADPAEVDRMMQNDPTVLSGLSRYTISPMHLAAVQTSRSTPAVS